LTRRGGTARAFGGTPNAAVETTALPFGGTPNAAVETTALPFGGTMAY